MKNMYDNNYRNNSLVGAQLLSQETVPNFS